MTPKRTAVLCALLLLVVAVAVAFKNTPSNVLGRSSLLDGRPGINVYPAADPGETTPLDRVYEGAPPLIPHNVEGLSVDRSTNDCLDCHLEGDEVDDGHVATAVPRSHFINEFTNEALEGMVVGMRYNCIQCHVPQADAQPR